MPIHPVSSGGYQWGGHGKKYYGAGAKQRAIRQAVAAHASGFHEGLVEEVLNEKVKNIKPRNLPSVPGLQYVVHYVADHKYFSLLHKDSGKYLLKSLPIEFVIKTVDLADHFFSRYDFTKKDEDIAKEAKMIHPALEQFKAEVERINEPPDVNKTLKKVNGISKTIKRTVNKKK